MDRPWGQNTRSGRKPYGIGDFNEAEFAGVTGPPADSSARPTTWPAAPPVMSWAEQVRIQPGQLPPAPPRPGRADVVSPARRDRRPRHARRTPQGRGPAGRREGRRAPSGEGGLGEFVGYLANVCPAHRGWGHGTGAPVGRPLADALTRMHCPCSAAPGPVDGTSRTLPEPADTPRRLPAANTEDPVTPPSAVRAWRTAYPSAKYVRYRYGGHIQVPDEAAARIARWVERSGG